MKQMTRAIAIIAPSSMSGLWALPAQADLVPTVRQPPITLKASKELPRDLLRGDNFVVHETVANDGFINMYQVKTDYGDLEVESTAELIVRVGELRASGKG